MSHVLTAPEVLATAAADVDGIASAISAANAAAAGPTTGLLPAGADEVSAAIAKLFGAYAKDYQAVVTQAAAFHDEFTQALAAAGSAYLQTEAANTALASGPSNVLGALNGPLQTLLGQTPVGTGGSTLGPLNGLLQGVLGQTPAGTGGSGGFSALTSMTKSASGDPITALIMGGTRNPQPDPGYVTAVNNAYIQNLFPGANPVGLFTPEQFWPITPQLGNLTYGQSVAQGVTLLNNAINTQLGIPGNHVVVFGYSQSAAIANNEIRALMASANPPGANQLSFVLAANPNNPDGGLLERFPGFYIPFLDVPFNGATPANSPWPTSMYTIQYDGIANAPLYPLNPIADLNAVMGYFYLHSTYPTLTAAQVANAVPLPTSPGYTGNTHYYMFLTQDLPLGAADS